MILHCFIYNVQMVRLSLHCFTLSFLIYFTEDIENYFSKYKAPIKTQ